MTIPPGTGAWVAPRGKSYARDQGPHVCTGLLRGREEAGAHPTSSSSSPFLMAQSV